MRLAVCRQALHWGKLASSPELVQSSAADTLQTVTIVLTRGMRVRYEVEVCRLGGVPWPSLRLLLLLLLHLQRHLPLVGLLLLLHVACLRLPVACLGVVLQQACQRVLRFGHREPGLGRSLSTSVRAQAAEQLLFSCCFQN